MSSRFQITELNQHSNRALFCCGIDALDRYIVQQAGQDRRRNIAVNYILNELDSHLILGYYSLSATSILLDELPDEIVKKLPRYPTLPAILLGRLAVDKNHQRKGIGELLLVDALKRSLTTSKKIGSIAVIVDSKNEYASQFYQRYGFIKFPTKQNKLFLLMATIEKVYSQQEELVEL